MYTKFLSIFAWLTSLTMQQIFHCAIKNTLGKFSSDPKFPRSAFWVASSKLNNVDHLSQKTKVRVGSL